jgi:DNA-binding NarL/FixJ family response regulator
MRVLIAEDQALLREGLASLFADSGHDVVSLIDDCRHVLAAVGAHRPDLVVIDVRMPPSFTDEGTRAAIAIKREHPGIGVLVLSAHIETAHTGDLVTLPGVGYLLKDRVLDVGEFLAAAQRVADGGTALDPEVIRTLLMPAGGDGVLGALSEREQEVLALMAEGLTNGAIARRLVVSARTVETHVRHLLMKLDLPAGDDGHKRVLAVRAYLSAAQS